MLSDQLSETFIDIINGNGVKRSVHHLVYENTDYTDLFATCLLEQSYNPWILNQTQIEQGFRVPGFLVENQIAYFGHLFWEVFNERRKRKIWGSVVRNKKGDWKYIITGNSSKVVYINMSKIQEVDLHYLT